MLKSPFTKLLNSQRFQKLKSEYSGDLLGGITGTAVALPQAMGLGVILFTSIGLNSASGALAGLLGAAMLSLTSGLAGATNGMISAPNGPVTMLLVASLYDLSASGVDASVMLTVLLMILVFAGVIQIILGMTFGSYLVKYIPYPVIAGLVTGIGLLMILSQIKSLGGATLNDVEGIFKTLPFITSIITLASIYLINRRWPQVPGILVGLIIGTICFQVLTLFNSNPVPDSWVVGRIPSFQGFLDLPSFIEFSQLPWLKILTISLAVAMLASIDCLLTAVVADGQTGARHNSHRELTAQGIGQIFAGLLGGIGGGGTKGSTLVAIESGGARWTGVVCALVIIFLILFAGSVGLFLPVSVLAGVIAYVGINMVDVNVLSWIQRRRLRVDAIVAIAVISSTLIYDLLVGLGVGLAGSVLLYIHGQVRIPVLHDRASGRNHRSLHDRSNIENQLLNEHGERIVYVELRGNLFFGTADRLFNELLLDLEKPVWMVINMRRVQHIDSSAVHLLGQMAARLQQNEGVMVFSNVIKHSGGFKKINKAFRQLGSVDDISKVKTFASTDAALQFAEDSLLASVGYTASSKQATVGLVDNKLCTNLDKKTIKTLSKVLQRVDYSRKKILFSQGDPGESIYLVLKGEVEIRLPVGRYHYKRAAKIGAGGYFGSVAFLRPGLRSTTGVVTQDCELLQLDRKALKRLMKQGEYETVVHILESVARTVARQLRWTRAELTRIEKA